MRALEQARAALRAGVRGLISPPYAACHAGVGYYAALVKQLREEFPKSAFTYTLCCGNDAAIAHDALRLGFTSIICTASGDIFVELEAVAHKQGASILRAYPQAVTETAKQA